MKIEKSWLSSAEEEYNYFVAQYETFKPVKKITVFYDSENFLLTKYRTDRTTYFVAENWKGNQIHLTNLNCGYDGICSKALEQLLVAVGLDPKRASELRLCQGLTIPFNENGEMIGSMISTECFFNSCNPEKEIRCPQKVFANFTDRKVYFVNPQNYGLRRLLKLLDSIDPLEFQYYIGKDTPLDNAYRYVEQHETYGVNLIIRGIRVDILCLIDEKSCMSVVNWLYYYYFNKSLFKGCESLWGILMLKIQRKKKRLADTERINSCKNK